MGTDLFSDCGETDRIGSLEAEKNGSLNRRSEIEHELIIPTIKEVSFEHVFHVLIAFFLQGNNEIISKITV
ncbi:hypothetical protein J42TS3_00770 [Paenibacillus vini]|uniref:Uncharacterized protein n=1 Tax=Paenibacillus vini TaxID=1476024 RepID=A0ABQ4M5Y3_9BACL|nr:hypothetical protein J42TS3_00770 [Paenibacillus vini]